MPKKVKIEPEVISLKILCPNHKVEYEFKLDEVSISASSHECDSCGTHGSVKLYCYKCLCDKSHEIELYEW